MTQRNPELCPLGALAVGPGVSGSHSRGTRCPLHHTRVQGIQGEAGLRSGTCCGAARFTAAGLMGFMGFGQVSRTEAGCHHQQILSPRELLSLCAQQRVSPRIPLGPWWLGTDSNSDSSSHTCAWSTEKIFPASGKMWALSNGPYFFILSAVVSLLISIIGVS